MRMFLFAGVVLVTACQSSPPPPSKARTETSESASEKASLGALVDPASTGSATEIATRYTEAISHGRLGEAFALLAPGSEAADGGATKFAARFRDRLGVAMRAGKAGEPVDADTQRLVEVPAVLSGVDKAGTPFRVEGPILLRVTDKSAAPGRPPRWQIVRAPFPA